VKEKGLFRFYESGHGECLGGVPQIARATRKHGRRWMRGIHQGQLPQSKDSASPAAHPQAHVPVNRDIDGRLQAASGRELGVKSTPWPKLTQSLRYLRNYIPACWKYPTTACTNGVLSALACKKPLPALFLPINTKERQEGRCRRWRRQRPRKKMWPARRKPLIARG